MAMVLVAAAVVSFRRLARTADLPPPARAHSRFAENGSRYAVFTGPRRDGSRRCLTTVSSTEARDRRQRFACLASLSPLGCHRARVSIALIPILSIETHNRDFATTSFQLCPPTASPSFLPSFFLSLQPPRCWTLPRRARTNAHEPIPYVIVARGSLSVTRK